MISDYAKNLAGLLNLSIEEHDSAHQCGDGVLYIGPRPGQLGKIWRFPWDPAHPMTDEHWTAIFREIKKYAETQSAPD